MLDGKRGRRRRARSRRGVPGAVAAALADRARERRARRRPRLSARQPQPSATTSSSYYLARVGLADAMDKRASRAVQRHAAARRHRARLRAVAQAAAARRALRHARLAHALGAAGSADGGLDAHAGHRDLRHPRRRRGDPARRPRGDDDQRPERAHRPASWRSIFRGRARAGRCSSIRATTSIARSCWHSSTNSSTARAAARRAIGGVRHDGEKPREATR